MAPDLSDLVLRLMEAHPYLSFAAASLVVFLYMMYDPARSKDRTIYGVPSESGLEEQPPPERRAALERVRRADAAFDEAAFLERAKGALLTVQDGWSRQDMSSARAFISDGVHERFARRIAEYRERGVRERISECSVRSAEVLGYRTGRHYDAVFVGFHAEVRAELVRSSTDEVLAGGTDPCDEVWTFLRRPGAKTLGRPGLLEGRCPCCGAPLPIADAAQCAACRAWVNSGEHDWVLTSITQSSEWEFPEPDRSVDGWEEMSAADPGLSLEALEDRAAVAFWRWLDARRRGDAAPLRGISTPAFAGSPAFDGTFVQDAVVGAVVATSFEKGPDWDRAHVQVRWAGVLRRRGTQEESPFPRVEQRTDFFVFQRRDGATSDLGKGLRASRCPSCGAAAESADAVSCAYCGRAFNDGSVAWVLAEIVPFGAWRRPGGPLSPPRPRRG